MKINVFSISVSQKINTSQTWGLFQVTSNLDIKIQFLLCLWQIRKLSILICLHIYYFLSQSFVPLLETSMTFLLRSWLVLLPSLEVAPTQGLVSFTFSSGSLALLSHLDFGTFPRISVTSTVEVSLWLWRGSWPFVLNYTFLLLAVQALIPVLCNSSKKWFPTLFFPKLWQVNINFMLIFL